MVPYLVIGYDILKKAFKGIRNRQVFDENFLMAVATIGAIALGDYQEGTAVMLFYQIGELFQSYAVGKSRRNISELMDIRPDYANIEKDGKLEKDLDGKSLIWTSSTKEERFRLAPGSYILTELEAPKGYELSDAVIEFTVTEDGRILFDKKEAENNMIVFKNTPEPEQVVTGSSLIYILFLGIITAGVVTFFVLKRND